MKIEHIYLIFYRRGDGKILRYVTNSPELYQQELAQLRRDGREIVRHFKERI